MPTITRWINYDNTEPCGRISDNTEWKNLDTKGYVSVCTSPYGSYHSINISMKGGKRNSNLKWKVGPFQSPDPDRPVSKSQAHRHWSWNLGHCWEGRGKKHQIEWGAASLVTHLNVNSMREKKKKNIYIYILKIKSLLKNCRIPNT